MRKIMAILLSLALCVTVSAPSVYASTTAKDKIIVAAANPSKSKAEMLKLNAEIGKDYDAHVLTSKEVNAFIKTYLSSKYTKLPLSEKNINAAFKTINSKLSINFSTTEVDIYDGETYNVSSDHNVSFQKGKTDKEWKMSSLIESSEGTGGTSGTVTEIRQYKTVNGASVYVIIGIEADESKTPFYVAFAGKSGKLVKTIGKTTYGYGYGVPAK